MSESKREFFRIIFELFCNAALLAIAICFWLMGDYLEALLAFVLLELREMNART